MEKVGLFCQWHNLPALVLWVSLSACSSGTLPPLPAKLGNDPYEDMTCDRLKSERANRLTTQTDLKQPPLFPSRTEAERKKELAQVQGEIKAIEKVQLDKKCPGASQNWVSHTDF
jgi:hypothetical protein